MPFIILRLSNFFKKDLSGITPVEIVNKAGTHKKRSISRMDGRIQSGGYPGIR